MKDYISTLRKDIPKGAVLIYHQTKDFKRQGSNIQNSGDMKYVCGRKRYGNIKPNEKGVFPYISTLHQQRLQVKEAAIGFCKVFIGKGLNTNRYITDFGLLDKKPKRIHNFSVTKGR